MDVVVEDRLLVGAARHVLAVGRVHVLPEAVVDAVGAHLDHGEELPRLRAQEVLGELEALVGHLVDLAQEVVLVLRAELRAVEEVLADDVLDLVAQGRRERVLRLRRGRQEARDHDAVERPHGERARHAQHDAAQPAPPDDVPQARLLDGGAVGDEEAVVGVVGAVAEAVDAEVARRPARHHAGPRRHRDRRHHRLQAPVGARVGERREGGQLVAEATEHEARLGAVEADDHCALDVGHAGSRRRGSAVQARPHGRVATTRVRSGRSAGYLPGRVVPRRRGGGPAARA